MGPALQKLVIKLSRSYVEPHTRVVNGKAYNVGGYWRDASELMKRLIDYKPERSLKDPKSIAPFETVLPGVQYERFVDVPFFDDLNGMIGVNVGHLPGPEYARKRNEFFAKQPIRNVPLDSVVVTQPAIHMEKVRLLQKVTTAWDPPPDVVLYMGKTYIMNGHHRVAAMIANGHSYMRARTLDLSGEDRWVAPRGPEDELE